MDLRNVLAESFSRYFEVFVLTAQHVKKGAHTPVGIATVTVTGRFDDGRMLIEPGVVFFPWATMRNKLETSVNFLNQSRKSRFAIMRLPVTEKRFAEQLCRYGVCRRVGTLHDYFGPGEPATEFQTRAG